MAVLQKLDVVLIDPQILRQYLTNELSEYNLNLMHAQYFLSQALTTC